jgi:hypothetical protein
MPKQRNFDVRIGIRNDKILRKLLRTVGLSRETARVRLDKGDTEFAEDSRYTGTLIHKGNLPAAKALDAMIRISYNIKMPPVGYSSSRYASPN